MAEPIGIYKLPQEEHLSNKNKNSQIIAKTDEIDSSLIRTSPMGIHHISNKRGQNIFDSFDGLEQLKTRLLLFWEDFLTSIGYKPEGCFITDAWLNLAPAKTSLKAHAHYNSLVSGTYYINYDPRIHSVLTFLNDRITTRPNSPTLSIPTSQTLTAYNSANIAVDNKEGDIVIWRSHLLHGYENNPTSGRTTLSFNIMPKICTDGQVYAFKAIPYSNKEQW